LTRGVRSTADRSSCAISSRPRITVARNSRAGVILLGKINLNGCLRNHGRQRALWPRHNPWALDRISVDPARSVAAIAGACARLPSVRTGGSIRVLRFCGTVGPKPTSDAWLLAPRRLASPDHVGLPARSVADAAILLGAIAGSDSLTPPPRPVKISARCEKPLRKFRPGRPREHYWGRAGHRSAPRGRAQPARHGKARRGGARFPSALRTARRGDRHFAW
jgi:Asp-tRNA(Asn)/Glu-tRNA(Gln) amidotransferase A subunit family amidase